MNNYFYSFLILSLVSCEFQKSDSQINNNGEECFRDDQNFHPLKIDSNGTYSFSYFEKSNIRIYEEGRQLNAAVIEPGDKTVFQFRYRRYDAPMVIDDEYSKIIQFEIDTNLTEFVISGDDLKKCKTVIGNFCYCAYGGYHFASQGCIKGEKLNEDEWKIKINIKALLDSDMLQEMLIQVFRRDDS